MGPRLESYVPDRRVPGEHTLFGFDTSSRYMLHTLTRLPTELRVYILGMIGRNNAATFIQRQFRRNITAIRREGWFRRILTQLLHD